MVPINIIQALFKSEAIQKFHSLSHINQSETKLTDQSTRLMSILPATNSEMTELAYKHSPTHLMDTVELTSSESSQFLQEQIFFQTSKLENISLRISGRKKKGKIDPAFCQLLFSLTLSNLNEVLIDVKVQNRLVSIAIYNQTEGIESLANELKSPLKADLESLGYQLSTVSVGKLVASAVQKSQSGMNNLNERVDIKI